MKNFSFKGRMAYFGLIALVSLGFFALQLFSYLETPSGAGSLVLLILWGLLAAFGLVGMFLSMKNRDRRND